MWKIFSTDPKAVATWYLVLAFLETLIAVYYQTFGFAGTSALFFLGFALILARTKDGLPAQRVHAVSIVAYFALMAAYFSIV